MLCSQDSGQPRRTSKPLLKCQARPSVHTCAYTQSHNSHSSPHSHTLVHSQSPTLTQLLFPALTCILIHHFLTCPLTVTHTVTRSHFLPFSHPLTHSHSHPLPHTLTHTHTRCCTPERRPPPPTSPATLAAPRGRCPWSWALWERAGEGHAREKLMKSPPGEKADPFFLRGEIPV